MALVFIIIAVKWSSNGFYLPPRWQFGAIVLAMGLTCGIFIAVIFERT